MNSMGYIEQSYDFAYDQSLVDGERLINDIRNHTQNFNRVYIGIASEKDKEAVVSGAYPNLFIATGKLFPLIYWGFVDLVKKVGFSVDTTYQPNVHCGKGFIFVYSSK